MTDSMENFYREPGSEKDEFVPKTPIFSIFFNLSRTSDFLRK